jgi:hypothetical protein
MAEYTCPECGTRNTWEDGTIMPCCSVPVLHSRIASLEAALIDARDTFAGDENDDRYWAWFNRHEDGAFKGLSPQRLEVRSCDTCRHVTGSPAFPDCDHPSGDACEGHEKWEPMLSAQRPKEGEDQ